MLLIPQIASRDWWMMTETDVSVDCGRPPSSQATIAIPDLFRDKLRFTSLLLIPFGNKELPQKGIQRLLHAIRFPPSMILLRLERAKIPFQDKQSSLLRLRFRSGRNEKRGMFTPSGRKFSGRFLSEKKRWCSDVREVASNACDRGQELLQSRFVLRYRGHTTGRILSEEKAGVVQSVRRSPALSSKGP